MKQNLPTRLIWVDLEMSGLHPDQDRVLEVALVVTDVRLAILAESPSWALRQPDWVLDSMDSWNTKMHKASGLTDRCRASSLDEKSVEQLALDFLKRHAEAGESPMCGNSICQDRRFLFRYLPRLERFFHYRQFDVSTLKIVAQLFRPSICDGFKKQNAHTAASDIRESIEEMRYYLRNMLKDADC